jgi:hypothetical protein
MRINLSIYKSIANTGWQIWFVKEALCGRVSTGCRNKPPPPIFQGGNGKWMGFFHEIRRSEIAEKVRLLQKGRAAGNRSSLLS